MIVGRRVVDTAAEVRQTQSIHHEAAPRRLTQAHAHLALTVHRDGVLLVLRAGDGHRTGLLVSHAAVSRILHIHAGVSVAAEHAGVERHRADACGPVLGHGDDRAVSLACAERIVAFVDRVARPHAGVRQVPYAGTAVVGLGAVRPVRGVILLEVLEERRRERSHAAGHGVVGHVAAALCLHGGLERTLRGTVQAHVEPRVVGAQRQRLLPVAAVKRNLERSLHRHGEVALYIVCRNQNLGYG